MKDFDKWNTIKKKIDIKPRNTVKEGHICWCNLGINIGFEQNGDEEKFQRPVIVLKKFSNSFILIAPLTSKPHRGNWYLDIHILNQKRQVILNQIKPIDIKRLTNSIGEISERKRILILNAYIKLIS